MKLSVSAYAKVNWCLDVTGVRADGYHELDMLMQSVSLADRLFFQEAEGLTLTVDRTEIPADGRNLVLRAAAALRDAAGYAGGAEIALFKQIPSEAGMGGGSADAAATLRALNLLWDLGFSDTKLEEVGLSVGADVPFCVRGGLQRVRGIGERLDVLSPGKTLHLLAMQPCRGLSTPEVFRAFREEDRGKIVPDAVQCALVAGDAQALGRQMGNALEPAAARMRPEIRAAKELLMQNGACGAEMTGSGSVVFGLFEDEDSCLAALPRIRKKYPGTRALQTVPFGSRIEVIR